MSAWDGTTWDTGPTHFARDSQTTLCGQRWLTIVLGNDPKARCEACCDEHARATGWSFPLPDTVA